MLSLEKSQKRFLILVSTVFVSGFSQGLLLPLLATLLEKDGVSSALNGLSSSALYIGMIIVAPFLEKPVRKYGYKPILLFGIGLVTVSVALIPTWSNFYFWIVLRLLVGIGDFAIHYTSQLWITTTVEAKSRGRSISIYGFSYGLGFALGPIGLVLYTYKSYLPFIVSIVLFLVITMFVLTIKNAKPVQQEKEKKEKGYMRVLSIAGIALLPVFIYGFLESTLNVSFPVVALRSGMSEANISVILASFTIGGLIFQLPLGYLSDYIGRKKVLLLVTLLGGLMFSSIPFIIESNQLLVVVFFVLAGGFTGSLYSLGLAYATDLLPQSMLPSANTIATLLYSIASIVAPYLGGVAIDMFEPNSIFYLLSMVIFLFIMASIFKTLFGFMRKI